VRRTIHASFAAALLAASPARAGEPPAPNPHGAPASPAPSPAAPPQTPEAPARRVVLNNLVGFRYNPLGLEDQLRAGVQQRLYQSERAALKDNFLFGGIHPRLNPAFFKLGPSLEIQPLSVFNLRLASELVGYYSTFGFLQSFRSALDDYSDSALRRGRDQKRNYSAFGLHVLIEPTVQLRFGPVVIRDKLSIEHWRLKLRPGDRVFYDVTLDTVVGSIGWVVQNDLDVLYLHDFKSFSGALRGARLAAGVRYTAVRPFYDAGDVRPWEDPKSAANGHHRVGPLAAFTFFDDGYSRFNKPTAIVIANWYVDHRFRTGRDTSAGIPYLILAFAFQSDLLD
jgi:hypothetical protein